MRSLSVLRLFVVIALGCAGSVLGASACHTEGAVPVGAASRESPGPEGDEEEEDDPDGVGEGTRPPPMPAPAEEATPIPSKIRYVLVIVKENHTFDNYFTGFPGAETSMTAKRSDGKTITRPKAPSAPLARDVCHSNKCGQRAYAGGAMNGFDLNSGGDLAFIRYTEDQIPNYWQYARNFVLADHLFSTTLGPSTPGHSVFWAGRSLSIANATCNKPGGTGCTGRGCTADKETTITTYEPDTCETKIVPPCFDVPSITDHLPAKFTWANYGTPHALSVKSVVADPDYKSHFRTTAELVPDLTAGRLANLTIMHVASGTASEHPPQYPCAGENLTVEMVNAAMKLPQWKEMAIVVTWDDWGGFYDHVPPTARKCKNGQIFQDGFRLPLIILSPYAKKGFVLKTPAEQASVPRLIEELWGVPFMSTRDKRARDGVAGSLMAAFDFGQAPRDPLILKTHTCP